MKKPSKQQMKVVGVVVTVVALVVTGVAGTLAYQKFISDTKAQGVSDFKATSCEQYADPKTKQTWLECDL